MISQLLKPQALIRKLQFSQKGAVGAGIATGVLEAIVQATERFLPSITTMLHFDKHLTSLPVLGNIRTRDVITISPAILAAIGVITGKTTAKTAGVKIAGSLGVKFLLRKAGLNPGRGKFPYARNIGYLDNSTVSVSRASNTGVMEF